MIIKRTVLVIINDKISMFVEIKLCCMKILRHLLFIVITCLLIVLIDYLFFSIMLEYGNLRTIMQIIVAIAIGTVGLAFISLCVTWIVEKISEISPSQKFASRVFVIFSIINAFFVLRDIWRLDSLGVFASIVLTILMLFITLSFCSANVGGKISDMFK